MTYLSGSLEQTVPLGLGDKPLVVWEIIKRLTRRMIKALLFGSCGEGTNTQSVVRARAAICGRCVTRVCAYNRGMSAVNPDL